jgi:hypothetical protein
VQAFIEEAFDVLTASFGGLFKNNTPDSGTRSDIRQLNK